MESRRSMRQHAVVSRMAPPLQACSRDPACSHRAAYSRGLAYSCQAAHSLGPTYFRGPACPHDLPSSLSRPKTISTIRTYDQAGDIFTTFLRGFDISQLKSYIRSLPHFHCSRRHIPSKLFQSKWRTTLVSTSHRVDERHCTTNNLGESTLATHQDPTCLGRGVPK
ncbi:hypothetical protein ACFX2I_037617 [Malus domestica]